MSLELLSLESLAPAAIALCSMVPGVTPWNSASHRTPADERLAGEVYRALLGTGRSGLQRVNIAVDGGQVTLQGIVPTYYMKQLAQELAMSVDGIERVHNDVTVE